MLQVKDLSVSFGNTEALKGVSFDVTAGDFIAIVGASGCGKSTLLNVISGIIEAREDISVSGKVEMQGERMKMAYGFQNAALLPWFNILKNVAIGAQLGNRGEQPEERFRIATKVLERVGLGSYLYHYPSALSGGMRQRAALARVVANDSDLILLDEPFGALDAFTRLDMQNLLSELWHENKKTVIMITHDLEEALILGSKIILMQPQPGRVALIRNNQGWPVPRRAEDLRSDRAFMDQVRELWELLRKYSSREGSLVS